jgi:hypothetical protein
VIVFAEIQRAEDEEGRLTWTAVYIEEDIIRDSWRERVV